jgi:glycosyltransferase involved in cell wall biosynthesis
VRIVIDFQSSPQGDAKVDAALALARQLASYSGRHTLWIAFSQQSEINVAALRAAFASVLPPPQLVVYDTPASDGSERTDHIIALVRDNFFAALGVDLVFTPGWSDLGASSRRALRSPLARFISAVSIADVAAAERCNRPNHFQHVNLVLAMSPAIAAALRTAAADAQVVEIGGTLPEAAQRIWNAIEEAGRQRTTASPMASPIVPAMRPKLAWIAPLSQQHDGTTEYAHTLPYALAQHYDIHLVAPLPAWPRLEHGPLPLQAPAWFAQHANDFDRIVYLFDNSEAHGFMIDLLARFPGTVILDNFFLGDAINSTDRDTATPRALRRALYYSHGYRAVVQCATLGTPAAIERYPANKAVLDRAAGVIARAPHMAALADVWYGLESSNHWRILSKPETDADTVTLAARYVAVIEEMTVNNPGSHYRALLRELATLGMPSDPRQPELIAAARAIAANQWPLRPRQLLVDVSAMVQLDMKTGISRVVRSILLSLLEEPPAGYRVEPVYADGAGGRYRYARQFGFSIVGAENPGLDDAPIEHQPGDIFLGLDLSPSTTTHNAALLDEMRERGMRVCFVLYDMLPLLQREAFAYGSSEYFERYLETIARRADGLVCISRAVADELLTWIKAHPPLRATPLQISYFHLGADIGASVPSMGLQPNADQVFKQIAQRPTLLMVGTVEPRKGHEQALTACELLWVQGVKVNLVIVGKPGWLVERLLKKLDNHPQLGTQLFWFPSASDEMLTKLYEACSALLAASSGEGFGLPLIEAARHGLPIIARDLPVFREVSGEYAFYFTGNSGLDLAQAISLWITLYEAGQIQPSAGMPWLSWCESARQLLSAVVDGNSYRTVDAATGGQG